MSQPPDEEPLLSRREYRAQQGRKRRRPSIGKKQADQQDVSPPGSSHEAWTPSKAGLPDLAPSEGVPIEPEFAPASEPALYRNVWSPQPAMREHHSVPAQPEEHQSYSEHEPYQEPWIPDHPRDLPNSPMEELNGQHEVLYSEHVIVEDFGVAQEEYKEHHRSPLVRWGALLGALLVVVVAGYFAFQAVLGLLPTFGNGDGSVDEYTGAGSGEVIIEVPPGAGGGQIAEILAKNDIVSDASKFTAEVAVDSRSGSIQPGTYRMAEKMGTKEALERMLDPEYRDSERVTLKEGLWKAEVFKELADKTGNEVQDYKDVNPADLGLPMAANGEMEGYLFPSTYEFGPDDSPTDQLKAMVDLGKERHAELGLEGEKLENAIIKGSLIQAEGAFSNDLPKIARVIENRLEEDQPLGFDSTIHFIYKERGRAGTSNKQRDNDSPYNTYKLAGLPPGPINNPGVKAIEAALDPAEGEWLYFVTTNPTTGRTQFADTFEEHKEYVEEFQQWCRDNPDDC